MPIASVPWRRPIALFLLVLLAACNPPSATRPAPAMESAPRPDLPKDMVRVDLSRFREALKGQQIFGRVVNGALRPYDNQPPTGSDTSPGAVPLPPPSTDKLVLRPGKFADLPGWTADRISEALPALRLSCDRLSRQPADRPLGGFAFAGTGADWQPACAAAAALPARNDAAVRAVFERNFTPALASNNNRTDGLFTGYYEPDLRGSRKPGGRFTVPLYGPPRDLVTVDLGLFFAALKGQRIAGRVVNGSLLPHDDRTAIENGSLKGQNLELVWVDDPVDAFFLQIQGSGRIALDDGSVMRVGVAAQNGYPYVTIGRVLVDRGLMDKDAVSMQSLRAWLQANPKDAAALLRSNPSYIFFHESRASAPGASVDGPLGAQGIPVTGGRSLAVDRAFLPLGLPLWLNTTAPGPRDGDPDRPLQRLLIAQDTGGAIKGPVRGDVFWGHGADAAAIAGKMKSTGQYWLLLPKAVAARLPAG